VNPRLDIGQNEDRSQSTRDTRDDGVVHGEDRTRTSERVEHRLEDRLGFERVEPASGDFAR